jgi:uncharacterized membrane protein YgcG
MKKSIALICVVIMSLFTVTTAFASTNYDSPQASVVHKVTYELHNTTSYNTVNTVNDGKSYKTTITPQKGYRLDDIVVLMGNIDITKSVVNGSTINIKRVTADLQIEAYASKIEGTSSGDSNNGNSGSNGDSNNGNGNNSGSGSSGSSGKTVGSENTSPETGDNFLFVILVAVGFAVVGGFSVRKLTAK